MLQHPASLRRRLTTFVAILLLLPALMGADIYRWVDANGVVNYTQQKPNDREAELVSGGPERRGRAAPRIAALTPTGASATSPAEAPGEDDPLTDNQQKILDDLKQAELDRQAALVEAKALNCERARGVLTNLTKIGRVRVQGPNGQQSVMGEDERQRRISAAQEAIAVNCAG